ncbi:MAG TPA: hypothetical protein VFK02_34955 [Kofleriaceae bacterium]|nr:hypothetical protein [Kofleriaceae bacterium]
MGRAEDARAVFGAAGGDLGVALPRRRGELGSALALEALEGLRVQLGDPARLLVDVRQDRLVVRERQQGLEIGVRGAAVLAGHPVEVGFGVGPCQCVRVGGLADVAKTLRPRWLVAMNAVERLVEATPITLRATLEDVEPLADPHDRSGRGSRLDGNEACSVTLERGQERGRAFVLEAAFCVVVRSDALDTLHMCTFITRGAEASGPSECDDDDGDQPDRSHFRMLLQTLHCHGVAVG